MEMKWQKIETAPKYDTWILLAYANGSVRLGHYVDNTDKLIQFSGFVAPNQTAKWDEGKPTHWMPLPEPTND